MLVMEEQEQSVDSPKSSTAENPIQDLEDKSAVNDNKIIQIATEQYSENDKENKENNENNNETIDIVTESEAISEPNEKIAEIKQSSPESLDIEILNTQPETESAEDADCDVKIVDEPQSNTNDNIQDEQDIDEKNENDVSKRPLEDKCDPFPKKTKISEYESDKKSNESGESNKFFTIQDLEQQENKILADIEYLDQLARKKEREWNNIIHLKKVKEEFLLRLQRKRQVLTISKSDLQNNEFDWESALDLHMKSLNAFNNSPRNRNSCSINSINCSDSGVTILPVPSVKKSIHKSPYDSRLLKNSKASCSERSLLNNSFVKQRSILPKPSTMFTNDCNGVQKTGPKGQPMMDVNLIVERFRQSNPEDIPRRGKRIRSSKTEIDSVSSTSKLLPMISLNNNKVPTSTSVQLIPNKVDLNSELGMLLTSSSDNNRGKDFQNDSSRSSHVSTDSIQEGTSGNISFKDVLVEFARLSQSDRRALKSDYLNSNNSKVQDLHSASLKSCPEVTLHPVLVNNGNASTISNQPASNSLLHGILTKNKPKSSVKPFTNLSPTLARLLTDTTSQPSDVSNINDLLANNQNSLEGAAQKKSNDFTIQNTSNHSNLTSSCTNANTHFSQTSGVYSLDELEAEDSYDRLVIDETNDKPIECDNMSEADATQIPPCQGCKRNPAQFVCAGCTSQWYCSRECQVSDWDQHAEICNG